MKKEDNVNLKTETHTVALYVHTEKSTTNREHKDFEEDEDLLSNNYCSL